MGATLQVIPRPRLERILQELRHELEALYGERLKGMYLFGSYARGEAEPGSDIDVAVVLAGELDAYHETDVTLEVAAALSLAHDTVISLVFMDEDHYLHGRSVFLMNLWDEAQAIR